ncbi:MAG: hypothetical protein IIW75_02585 [Bacteroidaceae bacterium]|nr:hypothetical protein [Bacteroidaceae bacterium]
MSELNEAQYQQLQARVNMIPWAQFSQYLTWTYQGRKLTVADFPEANEARKLQIEEALLNAPNPQEQSEWNGIEQLCGVASDNLPQLDLLIGKLELYITRWSNSTAANNHVAEAREKLAEAQEKHASLIKGVEDADWLNVDQFSIDSLLAFYSKYPRTARKDEIDTTVYNLSKTVDPSAVVPALNRYKVSFPDGQYIAEADRVINEVMVWLQIKEQRDLFATHMFIDQCPTSTFVQEAKILLMELKNAEISLMKSQFNEYSRNKLLGFIDQGIFSVNELLYNGVVTNESLRILRNYQEVRSSLPVLDDVIPSCSCECFPDHVDVFMFGIPATGKSCVLAGLLSANELNYDSVKSGGAYADALTAFLDNNCPPDPTKKNYLTTIKARVKDGDRQHNFDLVEMAGEEFAVKIANNPDREVEFEDMGSGAATLLTSPNNKVFFVVVDPTKNIIRFNIEEEVYDEAGNVSYRPRTITINQNKSLKRMIDLFNQPENEAVMKKVDAIHFIVTKADTIGKTREERLDKAVELMNRNYSDAIETLKEVCEHYGINRATNGVPYVFPFSLGEFYIGNICEYDSTDSSSIIDVMKGNTMAIRKETFWDKFKAVMNKGF